MDKIYLVKYSTGSYEDYRTIVIFATTKKTTATKYVSKFNKILSKWLQYYSQFEDNTLGINWIAEKHIKKHFTRWSYLRKINNCYWEVVSIR